MRKQRGGYTDFGSIQIPPLSPAIVLTDRADGSLWLLSFNSTFERLSINSDFSTIKNKEGVRIYEANLGPAMDEDGEFTIFVRSGRVGIDYNPFPRPVIAYDNAPPYARQSASQRQMKISALNIALLRIGYNT